MSRCEAVKIEPLAKWPVMPCELDAGHEGDHGYQAAAGWISWSLPTANDRFADLVKAADALGSLGAACETARKHRDGKA